MKWQRLSIKRHNAWLRISPEGRVTESSSEGYQWTIGKTAYNVAIWLRAHRIAYSIMGWRDRKEDADARV